MQWTIPFAPPPLPRRIGFDRPVMLVGSCFTEHISGRLHRAGFHTLQNPHGILFNPLSVARSLRQYIDRKRYTQDELFLLHERWNSWDHHTRFSDTDAERALAGINAAIDEAHAFLSHAGFLIVTLGSAFQYALRENGYPVSNNHRAPAGWFDRSLLPAAEIEEALAGTIRALQAFNPSLELVFTISPVRHIREGVVENNRSKARLIEAVHSLCGRFERTHYFPAYELVIDVLRDYRFYDTDLVHPNYAATDFVWEQFRAAAIDPALLTATAELEQFHASMQHRPRFPDTDAHRRFLADTRRRLDAFTLRYPQANASELLSYFSSPRPAG